MQAWKTSVVFFLTGITDAMHSGMIMFYYDSAMVLPDEIHAKECLLAIGTLSSPHSLIPKTNLVFICAHFCAPQPGRSAQNNCICVGSLLYLDVSTLLTRERETEKKKKHGLSQSRNVETGAREPTSTFDPGS